MKMAGLYKKYAGMTLGKFTGAAYMLGGTFATIFEDYWTVAGGMQSG